MKALPETNIYQTWHKNLMVERRRSLQKKECDRLKKILVKFPSKFKSNELIKNEIKMLSNESDNFMKTYMKYRKNYIPEVYKELKGVYPASISNLAGSDYNIFSPIKRQPVKSISGIFLNDLPKSQKIQHRILPPLTNDDGKAIPSPNKELVHRKLAHARSVVNFECIKSEVFNTEVINIESYKN